MCGAWVKDIVPGSVFAITIVKMALMSEMIETCPRSLVAMYVDDLALSTYGTEQDVIADHSKVTLTAIELFENAGLPVSRGKDGKSVFMASNLVVADGIRRRIQDTGLRQERHTTYLGVTRTLDKRRRCTATKERIKKFGLRGKRLHAMRKAGASTNKVVRAAGLASLLYGAM